MPFIFNFIYTIITINICFRWSYYNKHLFSFSYFYFTLKEIDIIIFVVNKFVFYPLILSTVLLRIKRKTMCFCCCSKRLVQKVVFHLVCQKGHGHNKQTSLESQGEKKSWMCFKQCIVLQCSYERRNWLRNFITAMFLHVKRSTS